MLQLPALAPVGYFEAYKYLQITKEVNSAHVSPNPPVCVGFRDVSQLAIESHGFGHHLVRLANGRFVTYGQQGAVLDNGTKIYDGAVLSCASSGEHIYLTTLNGDLVRMRLDGSEAHTSRPWQFWDEKVWIVAVCNAHITFRCLRDKVVEVAEFKLEDWSVIKRLQGMSVPQGWYTGEVLVLLSSSKFVLETPPLPLEVGQVLTVQGEHYEIPNVLGVGNELMIIKRNMHGQVCRLNVDGDKVSLDAVSTFPGLACVLESRRWIRYAIPSIDGSLIVTADGGQCPTVEFFKRPTTGVPYSPCASVASSGVLGVHVGDQITVLHTDRLSVHTVDLTIDIPTKAPKAASKIPFGIDPAALEKMLDDTDY